MDLDQDGDLDLVINNLNEPAQIFENKTSDSEKSNYLQIRLKGLQGNGDGVGASVSVYQNGQLNYQEQQIYKGYQGNVSSLLHFGLGEGKADSVEVRWKNRKISRIMNPGINQILEIGEAEAELEIVYDNWSLTDFTLIGTYPIKTVVPLPNDFKRQSQLLYSLSQQKVSMIQADLTGDGEVELILSNI